MRGQRSRCRYDSIAAYGEADRMDRYVTGACGPGPLHPGGDRGGWALCRGRSSDDEGAFRLVSRRGVRSGDPVHEAVSGGERGSEVQDQPGRQAVRTLEQARLVSGKAWGVWARPLKRADEKTADKSGQSGRTVFSRRAFCGIILRPAWIHKGNAP